MLQQIPRPQSILDVMTSGNPLFAREARALGTLSTPDGLRRWTWALLIGTFVLTLGVWGIYMADKWSHFNVEHVHRRVVLVLFLLGMALSVLLDVACVVTGINSDSAKQGNRPDDLIRMTAMTEREIVTVRYTVVKLRAWGMMMGVVGLRLAVAVLLLLQLFLMPVRAFNGLTIHASLVIRAQTDPLTVGLILLSMMLLLMVYIMEPLWRMRAMSALGLLMTVRGVLAFTGIWLFQLLLTTSLYMTMLFVAADTYAAYARSYYAHSDLMLVSVGFCMLVSGAMYASYRVVQRRELNRVVWFTANPD